MDNWSWIIPTAIAAIGLSITFLWRLGLWRWFMTWSPWPASLSVDPKAFYRHIIRDDSVHDYIIPVWIELEPWVTMNIHNFYLELHIDEGLLRAEPMSELEDTSSSKFVTMNRGYRLEPSKPIFKTVTFQYKGETKVNIGQDNYIVLETGRFRRGKRAIRKSIILEEEQ